MARLSQPPRFSFDDPADRAAYDAVTARRAGMGRAGIEEPRLGAPDLGDYFGSLLNSPQLCAIAANMGAFVRTAGERSNSYSHADREFADQVLSADWRTNIVQLSHVPDAVAAGVRLEAIEALRYGHEERLNEDERLLARYIRQVISGELDDATYDAMLTRLGPRGVVDYTAFILWLQWTLRMMQALRVREPPDAEIDSLIAALKQGTVKPPDFRERLG